MLDDIPYEVFTETILPLLETKGLFPKFLSYAVQTSSTLALARNTSAVSR